MKNPKEILLEFQELRARLEEAEQTLEAIRTGEVDALIVYGENGEQVFTLKGAEQPYRVFVEQMQEGAATLNARGFVLFGNQRLAEMIGRPLERTIGAPFAEFFVEADRPILERLLSSSAHATARAELTLVCDEGEPCVALVSISSLNEEHDADFAVTLTDLSERKRSEEILASERLARSILENAAEAIVVCDRSGTILEANAAATRLSGPMATQSSFKSAFPLSLDPSGRPLERALEGEDLRGIPAKLAGRDLLLSAGPLRQEGEIVGCVVTMTDITDRNSAFREVQSLNESLERRVDERTEQLTAANHELEGFTYSVSHDLRAPLRSIAAASMVLIEDFGEGLPEEAHHELNKLSRAANRMGELIDDLLRFSRLGRQEMRRDRIDMSALANEVVEEIRHEDQAENVQFMIEPGLMASGDRMLLRMVLENLLGNAVKFSRATEQPTVRIESAVLDGLPAFRVSDNGIGFDPRYLHKIFKPFERLHNDRDYPGTGIGLANVQRIVARHGGRVVAEGQEGEGAKFTFTLS